MATRLTLVTDIRVKIDERDADNSHFTDTELYTMINTAIRYMGTDLEWPEQKAQATSVAEQAVYTLPEDFIYLKDVYFDNDDLIVLDRSDLSAINGKWQDAPSGTPRYAYKSDNAKIGLYPKPNTDEANKAIQVEYIKMPADLDDDVDIPDLHTAFQDCLPYRVAAECERSMGNSKKGKEMDDEYDKMKKRLTSKLQRFSDDLMRFRWSDPRYR
jgi:hypothetical protein